MKRSYKQNCALAHALDLIGERWSLLIVRELLVAPRRYGELQNNLRGIGTNLLADRLKEMESNGLVRRDEGLYRLTAHGQRLEPLIGEIVRFGLGLGIEDDESRLTRPEWDVVALRALYDKSRDAGISGRYVISLDGAPFCIEKHGARLLVSPGDTEDFVSSISLRKSTARALASGATTFADADISVQGSRREAKKLMRAFGFLPA